MDKLDKLLPAYRSALETWQRYRPSEEEVVHSLISLAFQPYDWPFHPQDPRYVRWQYPTVFGQKRMDILLISPWMRLVIEVKKLGVKLLDFTEQACRYGDIENMRGNRVPLVILTNGYEFWFFMIGPDGMTFSRTPFLIFNALHEPNDHHREMFAAIERRLTSHELITKTAQSIHRNTAAQQYNENCQLIDFSLQPQHKQAIHLLGEWRPLWPTGPQGGNIIVQTLLTIQLYIHDYLQRIEEHSHVGTTNRGDLFITRKIDRITGSNINYGDKEPILHHDHRGIGWYLPTYARFPWLLEAIVDPGLHLSGHLPARFRNPIPHWQDHKAWMRAEAAKHPVDPATGQYGIDFRPPLHPEPTTIPLFL